MVKVAALQTEFFGDKARNLNLRSALKLLNEAGKQETDIACLPELFLGVFTAEQVPGPTTRKIGEVAKRFGMYVILNIFRMEKGGKYNSNVILDRNGEICGVYDKTHLFPSEPVLEHDTAGSSLDVFDLDFGRIGTVICHDANFPETMRVLTLKGAEIIFCPTRMEVPFIIPWEKLMVIRALENQVYVVSVGIHAGAPDTLIVSPGFRNPVMMKADVGERMITAELDLDRLRDRRKDSPLYHVASRDDASKTLHVQETYCFMKDRRPQLYDELTTE